MIDLHNHILPGVDDGAADLTESVRIGRQFASEGVEAVVATPHLDPLHGRGARGPEVAALVKAVEEALSSAGISLRVLPGHELFLTPEAPDLLKQGVAATLAGTPYTLVEVSLMALERPLYLDDTLFRLQLASFRPILAHPERYPFVQRDPDVVEGLRSRGITLQVTAPSLLGDYGRGTRRTAERLLESGNYALAASDRHHPGPGRSLATLHGHITDRYGAALADLLLAENPRRVVAGEPLVPCDSAEPRRSSWRGAIFRR